VIRDKEGFSEELPELFSEESHYKKYFVLVGGIFLLLLFLSYFLLGPNTMSIIAGSFESDTVNENSLMVEAEGVNVSFSSNVYATLKQMYLDNPEHEFKACLHGSIDGGTYSIDKVSVPTMFEQEFDHVVAEPCPPDTLVDFHSHPEKHCIPSYHDVQLLRTLQESNGDMLMAVMCGTDKITFYA